MVRPRTSEKQPEVDEAAKKFIAWFARYTELEEQLNSGDVAKAKEARRELDILNTQRPPSPREMEARLALRPANRDPI